MKRIRINWTHTGEGDPTNFRIETKRDPVGGTGEWNFLTILYPSDPSQYTYVDTFDAIGLEFATYRVKAQTLTEESGFTESAPVPLTLVSPVALPPEELN